MHCAIRFERQAFRYSRYLRHGHMEKVYENGLAHRLRKPGLNVEQQYPLQVLDEDRTVLGNYMADLFVENCLIVQLKAFRTLANDHIARLLGTCAFLRLNERSIHE